MELLTSKASGMIFFLGWLRSYYCEEPWRRRLDANVDVREASVMIEHSRVQDGETSTFPRDPTNDCKILVYFCKPLWSDK